MVIHLHHVPRAADYNEGHASARIIAEEATGLYPGQPWGVVEPRLANEWRRVRVRGKAGLSWSDVRAEAHAAWQVAKLDREGRCLDNAPVFDTVD